MASTAAGARIELQWVYSPSDYFEEQIVWERGDYLVEIGAGRITARMSADVFDSRPSLRDSLTQELKDYFLGAQQILHKGFELQVGGYDRIQPDGRRESTLMPHPIVMRMRVMSADVIITNQNGMVHDTRRERIDATKNLAQLTARYAPQNPTVRKMLHSFDASINDPGNELVYLYEVWEALQTRFRGERKARKALSISRADRSQLTHLCDKEPVKEGRHRGRFDKLREASPEELNTARKVAQDMIVKYLKYLDQQQQAG